MTEEARELHRIINATVRDMLSAYHIQAQGVWSATKRWRRFSFEPRIPS